MNRVKIPACTQHIQQMAYLFFWEENGEDGRDEMWNEKIVISFKTKIY